MSSKKGKPEEQPKNKDEQSSGPVVLKNFIDKGKIYRKGDVYTVGSGGAKKADQLKADKLIA